MKLLRVKTRRARKSPSSGNSTIMALEHYSGQWVYSSEYRPKSNCSESGLKKEPLISLLVRGRQPAGTSAYFWGSGGTGMSCHASQ